MNALRHREVNNLTHGYLVSVQTLVDTIVYAEESLLQHCLLGKKIRATCMSICRGLSLQKTIIQLSKNEEGPFILTWNKLQDICWWKVQSQNHVYNMNLQIQNYRHRYSDRYKWYKYRLEGYTPSSLGSKLQKSRALFILCAVVSPMPRAGCST